MDLSGMGLEQHLSDSGGAAEIAVDLERRMGIEQVVLGRFRQQGVDVGACLLTIPQAGVEIDQPGPAPAGVGTLAGLGIFVVFAPALYRTFRRGKQSWIPVGDGRARIQPEKVGHMTVTRLYFLIILDPFPDGVVAAADPYRRQLGHGILQRFPEPGVLSEYFRSLYAGIEEFHRDLDVHGGRISQVEPGTVRHLVGVLRGIGRSRSQITVLVCDHERQQELCGLLHRGIGMAAEIVLVAGEQIMLPLVQREPWPCNRESPPPHTIADGRVSEGIGHMVDRPSLGAEGLPGSHPSGHPYRLNPFGVRYDGLGKVAHLGRPVIHLDVDVGVEVRIPGSLEFLVPYSLKVGGKPARPAR